VQPQTIALSGYSVKVFPTAPQPFIAEVFVYYEKQPTPPVIQEPYIGIKLYNPFPVPVTLDNRYGIIYMPRSNTGARNWTPPIGAGKFGTVTLPSSITINANDYFVIDNMGPAVSERPPDAGDLSTVQSDPTHYLAIPGLGAVANFEMMLVLNRGPS